MIRFREAFERSNTQVHHNPSIEGLKAAARNDMDGIGRYVITHDDDLKVASGSHFTHDLLAHPLTHKIVGEVMYYHDENEYNVTARRPDKSKVPMTDHPHLQRMLKRGIKPYD
ncbi:MAG: hypothetical protein WCL05_01505 [Verrucomicrobiota bacterium]